MLYFMKLTPRAAMMGEQSHECRLKLYILWNLDCVLKKKKVLEQDNPEGKAQDNPEFSPRAHTVKRENRLLHAVLWPLHEH